MKTELKRGHYYYLVNGQCVVLDDFATRADGTEVYMVTPYYEGEAMTYSGAGGYHHEITAEYIHEGLPVLVDQLFNEAPTEKLCERYKAKLAEIENLSLAVGVLKQSVIDINKQKHQLIADTKAHQKAYRDALSDFEKVDAELAKLNTIHDQKKQMLSEIEDTLTKKIELSELGEFLTVTKKELRSLKKRSYKLECLENGGVDNWEWYGESLKDYHNRYPEE